MIETLFESQSPLGEPLVVYCNRWGEEDTAETFSLVTGLQGDQLTGLYVASCLSRFLDEVVEGKQADFKLTGHIQIFPVTNLRALESGTPSWNYDQLNADLAFPGTHEGELTEKICNSILQRTARSDYGILLKSGELHYRDHPQIGLYRPNRTLKQLARILGPRVARQIPETPQMGLNLIHHWTECQVQALTLSAGRSLELDQKVGDFLFQGLINFLLMTGLLSHSSRTGEKYDVDFFNLKGEQIIKGSQAGMFVPSVQVGETLRQGKPVGEILDLYGGQVKETILAPRDGQLITQREHPLVYGGEPLGYLLTEKQTSWFWPFS